MKRPIVIAVIGYILGIIWGLYFKISIAFLYAIFILTIVCFKYIKKFFHKKKEFKLFSFSRYFRYVKLILNRKVIIIIILFSIVSNIGINIKNNKFDELYENVNDVEIIALVDSKVVEKTYNKQCVIEIKELNGSKNFERTRLYLKSSKKQKLEYGNVIKIKGTYTAPKLARNTGGFSYKEYLKQLNIYGTVSAGKIDVIEQQGVSNINLLIYNLRNDIAEKSKKYLEDDTYAVYLGLILGDTSYIEEEVKEQFRDSNMAHILAVSGMHISYIILGLSTFLGRIIGKRNSKILTIFVLILYITITGFSPSIVRASLMGEICLLASIIYRKSDTPTAIAISLFVILLYNPYLICDLGLQFSYAGTIGIVLLNKNILKFISKGKMTKVKEIVAITISAQIFILPLTLFHFNTFGIYFLVTNLIISFIIGPLIILGFIFLIFIILNCGFMKFLSMILNFLIRVILIISRSSFLPMSKIYVRTPKLYEIITFYLSIIIINVLCSLKTKKSPSQSNLRIRYIFQVLKFKFRRHKKKFLNLILIPIIIIIAFILVIPRDLKIHFVDVGQGDCCFIETPKGKTILIDGGGNENGFDIGKNTLLPYILDMGYTKIDYIIISHFDTDHVGGLLTVMEELRVGQVIISKQGEDSENYRKFKEIVKEKKIKVSVVGKGDKLQIEKDLYFDILWPNNEKLINENILNNNSIVCKLHYQNFSILFTGDIEEIAEKEILKEYKKDLDILNSTILKVGHHGSKTSSTGEFIETVKPIVALIGVGENNKFGHPNDDVLERLENLRYKGISNRPNGRNNTKYN